MSEELLERFSRLGFTGLIDNEPEVLASHLHEASSRSGSGALIILAGAILQVYRFMKSEDEYGGVAWKFVKRLDTLTTNSLPEILVGESGDRASAAMVYMETIRVMIATYSPRDYAE